MRAFGEGFVTQRPPIDTKTVRQVLGKLPNGNKEICSTSSPPPEVGHPFDLYREPHHAQPQPGRADGVDQRG